MDASGEDLRNAWVHKRVHRLRRRLQRPKRTPRRNKTPTSQPLNIAWRGQSSPQQ